jgi:alpha-1,6-mannosyltransferase
MLLAMLGVAAVLAGLEASGGAALVAAAATKASALLLLPFALLANLRLTGRKYPYMRGNRPINMFLAGAVGAALVVGVAAYLGFGWDWTHAFGLAGENQDRTSHMSIPITFARLSGLGADEVRAAALILYALAFVSLLLWTWRGADWVRAAAWASFCLLLATSWLLPWYLIWALPLVAISRDRALVLLTLALTAYQLGARIPL